MKTKLILLASVTILFYTSSAEPISLHSVTNGESAAAYFAQFPYAGTNIASFSEFDFEGRRKDIVNILDQEILVASSNVLFAVAAYLSQGTPIPTENYRSEILAAHKQDRFFEFGDSNHVVRAGSAYFGPRARACRQQYEYRRSYNYDLCDFRRAVLKEIYDAVKKAAGFTEGEKKQILNGAMPTHAVYDNNCDFIVTETNALMHVADFLSQGQPLPTERRDVEFRNAIKHDRFIQYGNSNHVIRAGGIKYGPTSLTVRQLYAIKDRYNENLSEFRITMFRLMKRELARERWNIYTDDERKALLEEHPSESM